MAVDRELSGAPRWQAPWFAALHPALAGVGDLAAAGRWLDCIDALNRAARDRGLVNANGRVLAFRDASTVRADAYERHVWLTGEVPTRVGGAGGWHDVFNALAWLAFPRTKAALNALQSHAIGRDGVRAIRGGLRDAATLFDENAAVFVCANPVLADALRAFEWETLFVARRAEFERDVEVVAFGHALIDKLRSPYKAICAHAWIVDADPARVRDAGALDALVAAMLTEHALKPAAFTPLPVLGVPGWWDANRDPGFYRDPAVFRTRRSRRAAGSPAQPACGRQCAGEFTGAVRSTLDRTTPRRSRIP